MASFYSFEEARTELKRLRDQQLRSSEDVIDLWEGVVAESVHKLGDERWPVYEQVTIAALDCGRDDITRNCIEQLRKKFPDSNRVLKLIGLRHEALEMFDKAEKIYERILATDETNSVVFKRRIAMLKAKGEKQKAIEHLNLYLKKYMADYEAWMELCDLYLCFLDYSKAAFCMEELIMSNPHNHLYLQKYAEILYSVGGYDNIETARSYFAQALKINPNNMRALFGFWLAAKQLVSHPRTSSKQKTDNQKFVSWAETQIHIKTQQAMSNNDVEEDMGFLDAAIDGLKLTSS